MPASAGQFIMFVGSLTNGSQSSTRHFQVLAGDGAPVITGGWPKWQVIDRPQRLGMTVLQGYDPLTMTVPVMFDAVAHGSADQVEADIEILEWMAGRGRLYRGKPFYAATGDSPLVTVQTTNSAGVVIPLIPLSYQGPEVNWLVTDISYDAAALRDKQGRRVRQSATVTLTQYVANEFGRGADSTAIRQTARNGLAGKTVPFKVTRAADTYLKIAAKLGAASRTDDSARAIQQANKTNHDRRVASVRSIKAQLPIGATIRIPATIQKHGQN